MLSGKIIFRRDIYLFFSVRSFRYMYYSSAGNPLKMGYYVHSALLKMCVFGTAMYREVEKFFPNYRETGSPRIGKDWENQENRVDLELKPFYS